MNKKVSCIACESGDVPGGAHRCIQCSKAVHPFEGCSISCGDEEGYGEKRICVGCNDTSSLSGIDNSKRLDSNAIAGESNSIPKQLNEKKNWQRKPKTNRSYLAPVKNWNIDKKVQDKLHGQ